MRRFARSEIMALVAELPRYNLAESFGPHLSVGEALGPCGTAGLESLVLGYDSVAGDARLRELIAKQTGVEPDDVIITVGAAHALFLACLALCEHGTHAVISTPVFPPARTMLAALDVETSEVATSFDTGYQLNADDVARHLTQHTRLVMLASPQNPSGVTTGSHIVETIIAAMAQICPDAVLLIDETYRDATLSDAAAPSASSAFSRVVTCSSLSKCHGTPGLRVGWIVSRDIGVREQLSAAKFNSVIVCSTTDQFIAARLLERSAEILSQRQDHLALAVSIMARWVSAQSQFVEWVRPDAGALCCVRLKGTAFSDEAVEHFYSSLSSAGVAVAPGDWFGDERRIFRCGFGYLPHPELAEALGRLGNALRLSALGGTAG